MEDTRGKKHGKRRRVEGHHETLPHKKHKKHKKRQHKVGDPSNGAESMDTIGQQCHSVRHKHKHRHRHECGTSGHEHISPQEVKQEPDEPTATVPPPATSLKPPQSENHTATWRGMQMDMDGVDDIVLEQFHDIEDEFSALHEVWVRTNKKEKEKLQKKGTYCEVHISECMAS